MDIDEVADLLDYLYRGFPGKAEMRPKELDVWADTLRPFEHEDGLKAAEALVRESEFFPSIAKFLARTSDFSRLREMRTPPALPTSESAPSDISKAWIVHIRNQIAERDLSPDRGKPGETKHTGESWDSCPECIHVNAEIRRQTNG